MRIEHRHAAIASARRRYAELNAIFRRRDRLTDAYRAGRLSETELESARTWSRYARSLESEAARVERQLLSLGDLDALAKWEAERRQPFWWRATTQDYAWRDALDHATARRCPSAHTPRPLPRLRSA